MNTKRWPFIICAILALLSSAGCATNAPRANTPAFNQVEDKSLQLLSQAAGSLERFTVENKQLQATNALLQAEIGRLEHAIETYAAYFRISDYLISNKSAVISDYNSIWKPRGATLFRAMKGTGTLLNCEVEDVFVYGGYVVINTIFVSSNADGSGTIARGAILLDPDKSLEITSCEMLGQAQLSIQDLASLTSEPQIEERAKDLPTQPKVSSDGEWRISQENKDALVGAGLVGGVGLLLKLIANQLSQ